MTNDKLAAAYAVIGEVARLSNPDWPEARINPGETLDLIHAETSGIIGDVLRSRAATEGQGK
jgi:hypothetical protein